MNKTKEKKKRLQGEECLEEETQEDLWRESL